VDAAKQMQGVAESAQASAERSTTKTAPQIRTTLTPGGVSVDDLLQRIHARQWWTNLWLAVLAVPLALTLTLVFLAMIVPWVVTLSEEYLSGASETAATAPVGYGAPGPSMSATPPTFVAPELQAKPSPYAAPAASAPSELAPLFSPEPASKPVHGK
jgi:hypothetical protein